MSRHKDAPPRADIPKYINLFELDPQKVTRADIFIIQEMPFWARLGIDKGAIIDVSDERVKVLNRQLMKRWHTDVTKAKTGTHAYFVCQAIVEAYDFLKHEENRIFVYGLLDEEPQHTDYVTKEYKKPKTIIKENSHEALHSFTAFVLKMWDENLGDRKYNWENLLRNSGNVLWDLIFIHQGETGNVIPTLMSEVEDILEQMEESCTEYDNERFQKFIQSSVKDIPIALDLILQDFYKIPNFRSLPSQLYDMYSDFAELRVHKLGNKLPNYMDLASNLLLKKGIYDPKFALYQFLGKVIPLSNFYFTPNQLKSFLQLEEIFRYPEIVKFIEDIGSMIQAERVARKVPTLKEMRAKAEEQILAAAAKAGYI